jgi:diguanylate cyclase (GGDEF)-like protein
VVVFDIDHFKAINDKHGHAMGDVVLREVAATISRQLRAADAVARWGGEEFLVVLPSSPVDAARACAERIRRAVSSLEVGMGVEITVSGGVAELEPGEQVAEAIRRADTRLYEAKAAGRNRIC